MPYVGQKPSNGRFIELDALTASATATYTLQYNSVNYAPESVHNLIVSINGVVQKPSSMSLSGSSLTVGATLSSSDTIDYVRVLGDVGSVVTPTDGSVTAAKIGTGAVTSAKLDTNIAISGNLDVGTIRATNGTTALNIDANGAITKPLQPAFLAYSNSTQSNISADTSTTINFNTEIFDQGSDFNNSNYKFTAPVTGRYQLQFKCYLTGVPSDAEFIYTQIITSNRNYIHIFDPAGFDGNFWFVDNAVLVDMDASDTAHVVIYNRLGTASLDVYGGDNSDPSTYFSGYLVA